MAVIVSRALPDVRDGLKPVHRRILYSMMRAGRNARTSPTARSARIVGDVLGKYHPHGDTRRVRRHGAPGPGFYHPLYAGGGPGQLRLRGRRRRGGHALYRGPAVASCPWRWCADLDKETVDFYPNFDETLMQPDVLPSRFPNLLVNGSVGHRRGHGHQHSAPQPGRGDRRAWCACIDNPECTVDDLMQYIKGPDFPTGGVILGKRGIYDAYHDGPGHASSCGPRAKSRKCSNGRQRIVVTEIPYQVNKARLIEKIAELVHEKRLEGISDIRDESDRYGHAHRHRAEARRKRQRGARTTSIKHTQMQETFGAIMLALVDGDPQGALPAADHSPLH